MYRIVKTVPRCLFGRGSFDQLPDILKGRRDKENSRVAFIVDDFFKDKQLGRRIPVMDVVCLRPRPVSTRAAT